MSSLPPPDPMNEQWRQAAASTPPRPIEPEPVPGDEPPWPVPLLLICGQDRPAFPLAEAIPASLSPITDFLLAVSEHQQVPIDAPAMLLLAMGATSLAKKVEIDPGGWFEPPAIWPLVLMPPSERKSTTLRAMQAPITNWEAERQADLAPIIAKERAERTVDEKRLNKLNEIAAKKGTVEARQEAIKLAEELESRKPTTAPRLLTTEPTPEALAAMMAENQERALVSSAEADALDIMMGRYNEKGSPNFGIYLSGHSGDSCRIDRRGRSPLILDRPLLSIALIIQPEAVRGLFSSRAAKGRGLLARFLPVVPNSLVGRRQIITSPVPMALAGTYQRTLRFLLDLDIPSDPSVLKLTRPAYDLFTDFRGHIEPQLARGGALCEQSEWAGKLCGAIARICLVLHGLEAGLKADASMLGAEVPLKTMQAALAWAPYLIGHERVVAGIVGSDPETGTADRILAWLERKDVHRFSRRDLFTAVRNSQIRSPADLDPALGLLTELGYLRPAKLEQRHGPGQKPSPEFLVNPKWKRGAAGGVR